MKTKKVWLVPVAVLGLGLILLATTDKKQVIQEQLMHYRNLGKAFFENPTTKRQAVEMFAKALKLAPNSPRERLNYALALLSVGRFNEALAELKKVQKQAPSLPYTWFNLGIQYKNMGEFAKARAQLEQMARLVPDEAVTHYNLGVLYKMAGREPEALKQFELAVKLNPSLAAPHFQLFNSYRRAGKKKEAMAELAIFKKLKAAQKGAVVPEDMNWSFYSEIYDPIAARMDRTPRPAKLAFRDRLLPGSVDAGTAGLLAIDADGDGRPELLAWSANGIQLYSGAGKPLAVPALAVLKGVLSVAPADYDNDGRMDLCVATAKAPVLLHNTGGKFARVDAGLPAGRFNQVVWLDYDHDQDPDLFLLGARSVLLRNQGTAGFADHTGDFPFAAGEAVDALAFRVIPDTKMMDLLVSYGGGQGVLYRDLLSGVYHAKPLPLLPAGAQHLVCLDVDDNSTFDVAYSAAGKVGLLLNHHGKFIAAPVSAPGVPVFADLENRGYADLVAQGRVYRNLGQGHFAKPGPVHLPAAVAGVAADFNGDHRMDVATVTADGKVHLMLNQTRSSNKWMEVKLIGRKAPKLAPGSEVEVKAGLHYQKKVYPGRPILFGMDGVSQVDTVRITWSNGLIQNATKQATDQAYGYQEEERLSGSCPMVWAWDGRRFRFVADILGAALLGVKSGEASYFVGKPSEVLQIPGRMLAVRGGSYEIRITQELAEVAYLDRVRLEVLDHPVGEAVYTNEQFQAPPFPKLRFYGVWRRYYPVAARDSRGRDVRGRLLRVDQRYPDRFRRLAPGVAERHALELDFGRRAAPGNDAVLVLYGWTDWSEGSTYLGYAQQEPGGLRMPEVQVWDAGRRRWQTVVAAMGVPSGFPRPIVVDLAGKFVGRSRRLRIVTNMCLYWDQAFLAEKDPRPRLRRRVLGLAGADLHFRGFARVRVSRDGRQPEQFFYAPAEAVSMWNPTPGYYTRYGKVQELLGEVDDRFVILGAGDELRLRFDARRRPPLPAGWQRDFLLRVDGWEKDQDPNTAYSTTVAPLPFHGMSGYPYPASEHYPRDAFHRRYRREYNTRPARRLLRPLAENRPVARRTP